MRDFEVKNYLERNNLKEQELWASAYLRSSNKVRPRTKQRPTKMTIVLVDPADRRGYEDLLATKNNTHKIKEGMNYFFTMEEAIDFYNKQVQESIEDIELSIKHFQEDVVKLKKEIIGESTKFLQD